MFRGSHKFSLDLAASAMGVKGQLAGQVRSLRFDVSAYRPPNVAVPITVKMSSWRRNASSMFMLIVPFG